MTMNPPFGMRPGVDTGTATTDQLEVAYREQAQNLRQLAHTILGSATHIEDVVQDAFAKALRSRSAIEFPAAYLRTAVVNGCRDRMRRSRTARKVVLNEAVSITDPELDEMWSLLRHLPPKQRLVLALRYGEDMGERQIAELLKMPHGTVKTQIARGLATLRKDMK